MVIYRWVALIRLNFLWIWKKNLFSLCHHLHTHWLKINDKLAPMFGNGLKNMTRSWRCCHGDQIPQLWEMCWNKTDGQEINFTTHSTEGSIANVLVPDPTESCYRSCSVHATAGPSGFQKSSSILGHRCPWCLSVYVHVKYDQESLKHRKTVKLTSAWKAEKSVKSSQ